MHVRSTRLWPQILLAGYWFALALSTHWPNLRAIHVPGKDKTLHVIAFSILASLLMNVLVRRPGSRRGLPTVLAMLTMVGVYGAIDEWTQPLTGRSCELTDWLADIAAAALVGTICLVRANLRPVRA